MCGFAGVIDLNHLDVNNDLDRRMLASLDSLNNRGPDQKGIYKDDYSKADFKMFPSVSSNLDSTYFQKSPKSGHLNCRH